MLKSLILKGVTWSDSTIVPTRSFKIEICSRNKNPLVKFEFVAPALTYMSNLLEISDQDVLGKYFNMMVSNTTNVILLP